MTKARAQVTAIVIGCGRMVCRAKPGEPCNYLGEPLSGLHNERINDFKQFQSQYAVLFAVVRGNALDEAADEVQRVREHGLDPGMESHPTSEYFDEWLRERADHIREAATATREKGNDDN